MAAVMKNNFYLFIFIYLGVGGSNLYGTVLLDTSAAIFCALLQSLDACEVACKPPLCLSCEPRQIPCFSFWSPLISKHTCQTRADQQENVKRRRPSSTSAMLFIPFFFPFQSVYSKHGCIILTLSVNRIC